LQDALGDLNEMTACREAERACAAFAKATPFWP
jgi:hypothetical protein